MNFKTFLKENWDQEYPPIQGGQIEGLQIKMPVPNTNSIGASLNQYTILPQIRQVEMWPNSTPTKMFYAKNDVDRAKALAEEIKTNKWISPLIVAIDADDNEPYLIEGHHRLAALAFLGFKSFPALVVVED